MKTINEQTINAYVQIIHAELVAATGCTEPIAIAYCAAKAREILGVLPESMAVDCSGNIIKNVKGVVVPNSGGRKGIDVAAVLGAVGGDPSRGLDVLAPITEEHRQQAAELLSSKDFCRCGILGGDDTLDIAVTVYGGGHSALVKIRGDHTHIIRMERDGEVLHAAKPLDGDMAETLLSAEALSQAKELLNVEDILTFAGTVDLDLVRKPLEAQIEANSSIAREGLKNDYGVRMGKAILKKLRDGDTNLTVRACAMAAAGSDARMSGCPMPVIINSGSGNQGLTVSLPVVEFASGLQASHDQLLRALIVSNLISIHQKRYLGNLSAYCGATSAATGAVCGIAFMKGYGLDAIANTITNTITTIGGMVCDGAKPSCAAKIASALDTAFMAFELQQDGGVFAPGEGLVRSDVEKTIQAIGKMGRDGMKSTDSEILDIMMGD
ncbi:MAG TPA: L-serine ammonia-lyase, iron-sulfur-dependent, subunit alpha [Candidatus Limiplasma sp.]|nr:L-serine ammonia-lyase, iron-sulfur-dependent, subunit alpha [Candidatus Limiplasma sp.]HRX09031.1 L-serine ammonia-lyase, iron-sulfur-dependent, subunit alpha [Candidatus Limiplasma sp.]